MRIKNVFRQSVLWMFLFCAAVAAIFLAMSARSQMDFDPAKLIVEIPSGATTISYTSPEVETPVFTAWFLRFTETGQGAADVSVRFFRSDVRSWSEWQQPGMDDNEGLVASNVQSVSLITGIAERYQFRLHLTGHAGYRVYDFSVGSPDTRTNFFEDLLHYFSPRATAQVTALKIISRDEWGADAKYLLVQPKKPSEGDKTPEDEKPGLRQRWCADLLKNVPDEFKTDGRYFDKDATGRDVAWPRTYSKEIKKIVVHHTAGSDKDINNDGVFDIKDGSAIVKAIYYRHAIFNGWGDIGYNYLIDPAGNIYEGRTGGDYVVAAHAYCANVGSIGIAFIGNFDTAAPTIAAVEAGTKLIGELANLYHLDPAGRSAWHGRDTPNVVGHRDYGYTDCPGGIMYNSVLADMRNRAATYAVTNRPSDKEYDYRAIAGDNTARLAPLATATFSVQLMNIGKKAWPVGSRFTIDPVEVQQARDGITLTESGGAVAILDREVPAGANYELRATVQAGLKSGRYRFSVTPEVSNVKLPKIALTAYVSGASADYEVMSAKHPPWPFPEGMQATAWLVLKNKSNFTWSAQGEHRTYLGAIKPTARVSPFTGSDVLGVLEKDTPPGEIGRFTMVLTAPQRGGRFMEYFAPVVTGFGSLPDYGLYFDIMVREPRFSASVVEKSRGAELRFLPNETKNIFVTLKNTSQLIWKNREFTFEAVRSGAVVFDPAKVVLTSDVPPNTTVSIGIPLTAPPRGGKIALSLRPKVLLPKVRLAEDTVDLQIEVESPRPAAELVSTPARVWLPDGGSTQVTVAYRNTGNFVWVREGRTPVRLAVYPDTRDSVIRDASWANAKQPALLVEAEVRPGAIGHFTFTIFKKGAGRSDELFVPVMDGVGQLGSNFARISVMTGEQKVEEWKKPGEQAQVSNPELRVAGDPSILLASADSSVMPVKARIQIVSSNPSVAQAKINNTSNTSAISPKIRIKLSFANERVELAGQAKLLDESGRELSHGDFVSLTAKDFTATTVRRIVPDNGVILTITNWRHNPGWSTKVNDNRYRGVIEVRLSGGKLIVVNELPIEEYVRGIAEPLPTDPAEKTKLLAILSRSYALFYIDPLHRKYPGQPYDGSDDPATFQKYLGYSYELRGNMPQAAEATQGLVVTYQGAVVKTPYFTSSDGRTKTPREAKWPEKDFLFTKVVEDPWSCGGASSDIGKALTCPKNTKGHGVGISGTGMTGLAKEGKKVTDILNYFFKDVVIDKKW